MLLFALAAVAEIGGAWLVWQGVREHRGWVWIGAGVIILDGVTIGPHAVIGAGSVVTKDIPADSIAVGVPARVMRKRGEKEKTAHVT